MKKVLQEKTGYPHGSCVQTSYASLLELPLSEVPKFDVASLAGRDQIETERKWLNSRGLDLIIVQPPSEVFLPPNLYHLISVETKKSPAGSELGHRVVGRGGKIVWNGNPKSGPVTKIKAYLFVVPLKQYRGS